MNRPTVTYQAGWADNVPLELRQIRQWLLWRFEERNGKWTKVPVQADGRCARPNEPSTWDTFEVVLAAYQEGGGFFDGIGFVFTAHDPYVGIDLDQALGEDGRVRPWAARVLETLDGTYAEVSPSGRGIKLWARASLPVLAISSKGGFDPDEPGAGVEVCSRGHFFPVTGRVWGVRCPVADSQEAVAVLHADLLAPTGDREAGTSARIGEWETTTTQDDPSVATPEKILEGADFSAEFVVNAVQYRTIEVVGLCMEHLKSGAVIVMPWDVPRVMCDACRHVQWGYGLSGVVARRLIEWFNLRFCFPPWTGEELDDMMAKCRSEPSDKPFGWLCQPRTAPSRVEVVPPTDDDAPLGLQPWPAPPDDAAYHGIAGRLVRLMEPETEADPGALLVHLLIMFGNLVGPEPYYKVESTYHHMNENAVFVGPSAIGRKGTAYDRIIEPLAQVDEDWAGTRVLSGLSSGEGLIHAVRDPVFKQEPVKENGKVAGYQEVMTDGGVADKRLLVVEPEFGRTLTVQGREGNTLSAIIRQAWDGKAMAVMIKSAYRATRPHVSIIGHITMAELRELLTRTDVLNGFANRFLWLAVRRSKLLPFGGRQLDLTSYIGTLKEAADRAKSTGKLVFTPAAKALWEGEYARLADVPPGALGTVLSRGAPHVLRLAGIYALLDRTSDITEDHLGAALALWDASARCCAYIFGDKLGNPDAEKILAALEEAGPSGLSRTQISVQVFHNNRQVRYIKEALALLIETRRVREEVEVTAGRSAARYYLTKHAKETKKADAPRALPSYLSSNSYPERPVAALPGPDRPEQAADASPAEWRTLIL
jgi:hypothetical protein